MAGQSELASAENAQTRKSGAFERKVIYIENRMTSAPLQRKEIEGRA
jgi:hypothetical protein